MHPNIVVFPAPYNIKFKLPEGPMIAVIYPLDANPF